jgi:hypothetical protein
MRNAYEIFFGRPGRRWEDNIMMDLREINWEGVDWIHLAEDKNQWWALVYTALKLRLRQPSLSEAGLCFMELTFTEQKSGNGENFCGT